MSYQVIARKWRPQNFSQLIGQDHVTQTLLNALRKGRLPHALLFTGPRGTGKTSTARILSKSLRCSHAVHFIPCHKCSECEEIAIGRNINVLEIDGASHNGVDSIRELRESLPFLPSSGHYKIVIIDEVHMLSSSAFNALLKTLEEPPAHVVFMFATTEVHKIPDTILSRCQRFDLKKIPLSLLVQSLKEICLAESVSFEHEALVLIARLGNGSMRDAQSILDQMITYTNGKMTALEVSQFYSLTDFSLLKDLLGALIEQNQSDFLSGLFKLSQSSHDPQVFLNDWMGELKKLLLIKIQIQTETHAAMTYPLNLDEKTEFIYNQWSPKLSEEDLHTLYDISLKGAQDLLSSQDPSLTLELILLRLFLFPKIRTLKEPLDYPKSTETKKDPPSVKKEDQKTSNRPELKPLEKNSPLDPQWLNFCEWLKNLKPKLYPLIQNTFLLEFSDNQIQIGIPQTLPFVFDHLTQNPNQSDLQSCVDTAWGEGIQIQLKMSSEGERQTPKKLLMGSLDQEHNDLMKRVQDNTFVKQANTILKTQISHLKEIQ